MKIIQSTPTLLSQLTIKGLLLRWAMLMFSFAALQPSLFAQTDSVPRPKTLMFRTILPGTDTPQDILVEVRDSLLIWDGDMVVGTLKDTSKYTGIVVFGVGVSDRNLLWPNGIVPYVFDEGSSFTNAQKDTILAAIAHINNANLGVTIRPRINNDVNYVLIYKSSWGAYFADVGRKGGQQLLSVCPSCNGYNHKGSTIHELLHTLGITHEHQRSDRNKYLGVLGYTGIINDAFDNVLLLPDYTMDIGDYDHGSIMHYSKGNYEGVYLVPPKDVEIGQRIELSATDKSTIKALYNSNVYINNSPLITEETICYKAIKKAYKSYKIKLQYAPNDRVPEFWDFLFPQMGLSRK